MAIRRSGLNKAFGRPRKAGSVYQRRDARRTEPSRNQRASRQAVYGKRRGEPSAESQIVRPELSDQASTALQQLAGFRQQQAGGGGVGFARKEVPAFELVDVTPKGGGGGGGGGGGPASVTGNLVSLGGYQFDSGVVGKLRGLMKAVPNLQLSSGYRSQAHNARVGGVPTSYHLSGRAADFSGPSKAMEWGAVWARNNGAREVLIHNAGSGMHLHVAW